MISRLQFASRITKNSIQPPFIRILATTLLLTVSSSNLSSAAKDPLEQLVAAAKNKREQIWTPQISSWDSLKQTYRLYFSELSLVWHEGQVPQGRRTDHWISMCRESYLKKEDWAINQFADAMAERTKLSEFAGEDALKQVEDSFVSKVKYQEPLRPVQPIGDFPRSSTAFHRTRVKQQVKTAI